MGTTEQAANGSDLEGRVALLEDALHRTRQRADLFAHAVEELSRMHCGRGLNRDELVESLSLHRAPAAAFIVLGARLLEPDHPEANEPQVLSRDLVEWPGGPAGPRLPGGEAASNLSDLATRARLAGARYAFDGSDPLEDLRPTGAA